MSTIVIGDRPWNVDPIITQMLLPEAYRFSSRRGPGPYGCINADDLISQSELIRGNYVSWNAVRRVWMVLVTEMERQYPGDIDGLILSLREALSEIFQRDRARGDFTNNRLDSMYPRTLETFMCLAEISAMCRSKKIGNVLSSFFNKHGETIVQTDPVAIDLWGKSIVSACLTEGESKTLLREFLRAHPVALGNVGMGPRRPSSPAFMDRLQQLDLHQVERGMDLDRLYPRNGGFLRGFSHPRSMGLRPGSPPFYRSRSSPPFAIQDRMGLPFAGHGGGFRSSMGCLSPQRALDSVVHATTENQMEVENLHDRIDALEDQVEYGMASSKLLPFPRYNPMAGDRNYNQAALMF